MGSGGNKKLGPCTFWVLYRRYVPANGGNTIWANRLIFSHQTYMGTVSDIRRSRKKDDIVGKSNISYVILGLTISLSPF